VVLAGLGVKLRNGLGGTNPGADLYVNAATGFVADAWITQKAGSLNALLLILIATQANRRRFFVLRVRKTGYVSARIRALRQVSLRHRSWRRPPVGPVKGKNILDSPRLGVYRDPRPLACRQ
jgi:hypothetical protein